MNTRTGIVLFVLLVPALGFGEGYGNQGQGSLGGSAGDPCDREVTTTIVARVNGEPVDVKDFVAQVRKRNGGHAKRSQIPRSVVERAINEELVRQALEASGITVSDDELAAEMGLDIEEFRASRDGMEERVEVYHRRVELKKLMSSRGLLQEPTEADLVRQYDMQFRIEIEVVLFPISAVSSSEERTAALAAASVVLGAMRNGVEVRQAVAGLGKYKGSPYSTSKMLIRKTDKNNEAYWKKAETIAVNGSDMLVLPDAVAAFRVVSRHEPEKSFEQSRPDLHKTIMDQRYASGRTKLIEELRSNAKIVYFEMCE